MICNLPSMAMANLFEEEFSKLYPPLLPVLQLKWVMMASLDFGSINCE